MNADHRWVPRNIVSFALGSLLFSCCLGVPWSQNSPRNEWPKNKNRGRCTISSHFSKLHSQKRWTLLLTFLLNQGALPPASCLGWRTDSDSRGLHAETLYRLLQWCGFFRTLLLGFFPLLAAILGQVCRGFSSTMFHIGSHKFWKALNMSGKSPSIFGCRKWSPGSICCGLARVSVPGLCWAMAKDLSCALTGSSMSSVGGWSWIVSPSTLTSVTMALLLTTTVLTGRDLGLATSR